MVSDASLYVGLITATIGAIFGGGVLIQGILDVMTNPQISLI
jgi:hypothetical protein